jgi:hypothetical protein
MGSLLLENPLVHFYLLYVGALVAINLYATIQQPRPAEKTSSIGVETRAAKGSSSKAP